MTTSQISAIITNLSHACASEWMAVSSLETMTTSTESTWTLAHGDREAFETAVLEATGEKPSREDIAAFDRALQRSLDGMIESARDAAQDD